MIKEKIKQLIKNSIKNLQNEEKFIKFEIPEISIEYPREKTHGDYSCNIALQIAKIIFTHRSLNEGGKKKPLEIGNLLVDKIISSGSDLFEKVEVAAPGFINFFISKEYLRGQIKEILRQKEKFGALKIGNNQKINIEFISANPTGPLTLGNGRGGFCGDVLANVLNKAGYKITREYYINNQGEQIIKLGHSVLGDEQAVYKGAYIEDLRKKLLGCPTPQFSVEEVGERAAQIILKEMIKPTIKRMGINFDVWFSEKSLYKRGEVDRAIKELTKKRFTYKSEGAVWFKSKELEDDKDRVLIRADGIKTYFASDIAYLENKIERGFKKIILFLGADHYGYVARLKAAVHVLGFDKENLNAIVMQLVHLYKDGREIRMSKRAGTYVTLDELLGEVGLDITRFFFLQRSANTHLNFDLNLAKEQSAKNPVYYVQYAHARICAILRKCGNLKFKTSNQPYGESACERPVKIISNLKLLKNPAELALIKQLIKLPEIVEDTTKDYQAQRLPQYAIDLADTFHKFYENCRVIGDDKNLARARLDLIQATKIVLKNTLDLMGISAPEKM